MWDSWRHFDKCLLPNCLLTSSLIAKSCSSPLLYPFFLFLRSSHLFIWLHQALELLLSCPTACGILVLQTGTEPTSPALQSRFLTTEPPGKSLYSSLFLFLSMKFSPPIMKMPSLLAFVLYFTYSFKSPSSGQVAWIFPHSECFLSHFLAFLAS